MDLKVTQDPENVVVPEVLASSIKKIADAVNEWSRAGMKRRALVVLLHDMTKVNKGDIITVLESIQGLEREYCIPKPVIDKKK